MGSCSSTHCADKIKHINILSDVWNAMNSVYMGDCTQVVLIKIPHLYIGLFHCLYKVSCVCVTHDTVNCKGFQACVYYVLFASS